MLDVSGSMEGDRLDGLKAALRALTGLDQSVTGQFARFRAREDVTFVLFSTDVLETRSFTIDDTNPNGPDMTAIRDYVDGLERATGPRSTPRWNRRTARSNTQIAADPDKLYSVVLMTDGENNEGISLDEFRQEFEACPTRSAPFTRTRSSSARLEQRPADTRDADRRTLFDATSASLADDLQADPGLPVSRRRPR